MIDTLAGEGRARESMRKCRTALSMVLDYAGASPNPGRDQRIKLPLAEPNEIEPPHADHVEAAAWLLSPRYLLALLVLDATGARVGELHAATIGDLDEERKAWLVRAKVSKTRRARWVRLPEDLFATVLDQLPGAREDRDPGALCSRSARRTACAWRSVVHAGMRRFQCSAPTTSGIAGSACSTIRATAGRRSARRSDSATSPRRPIRTRTCSWTIAR